MTVIKIHAAILMIKSDKMLVCGKKILREKILPAAAPSSILKRPVFKCKNFITHKSIR